VTAFQTLVNRLDTGRWGDTTNPADMNATAAALGVTPTRFVPYRPAVFLRPFDARNLRDGEGEDAMTIR
jgi:hypothetical protein